MLAEALDEAGYDVDVAHDAAEALRLAPRRPDVALLDMGLTVIAVTGHGQEHHRARGGEAGFTAHLVKPVNLHTLLAMLDAR